MKKDLNYREFAREVFSRVIASENLSPIINHMSIETIDKKVYGDDKNTVLSDCRCFIHSDLESRENPAFPNMTIRISSDLWYLKEEYDNNLEVTLEDIAKREVSLINQDTYGFVKRHPEMFEERLLAEETIRRQIETNKEKDTSDEITMTYGNISVAITLLKDATRYDVEITYGDNKVTLENLSMGQAMKTVDECFKAEDEDRLEEYFKSLTNNFIPVKDAVKDNLKEDIEL